jgi:hypothetical protein
MLGCESVQGRRIVKQTLAPAFDAVQFRSFFSGCGFPAVDFRANRRRIDVTHEFADELQLASPSFMCCDALRGFYRITQGLRHFDLRELTAIKSYQFRPERLQRMRIGLAAGFARAFIGIRRFV